VQQAGRGKEGSRSRSAECVVLPPCPDQEHSFLTDLVQGSSCVVDIHATDSASFLKTSDDRAFRVRSCSTQSERSDNVSTNDFSQHTGRVER
jgi:hypothetical protein